MPTRFCSACGATNAWSAARCGKCKETLPPWCFRCYADVTPTARRCPRCARSRFYAGDTVMLFCEHQANGKGGHLHAQETVHRYDGLAFDGESPRLRWRCTWKGCSASQVTDAATHFPEPDPTP